MLKQVVLLSAIVLTTTVGCQSVESVISAALEPPPVQTPVRFSGSGRIGLTDSFPMVAGRRYFKATHDGDSYFVVHLTDLQGEQVHLIFRHQGSFEGSYNHFLPAGDYHFDVEADGEWTLEVE